MMVVGGPRLGVAEYGDEVGSTSQGKTVGYPMSSFMEESISVTEVLTDY